MTDTLWGGDPDSIMYDCDGQRTIAEHDYNAPKMRFVQRNYAGPYCFRCHAKVDYQATGDPMDPTHVYDRGMNVRHYWRCFEKKS